MARQRGGPQRACGNRGAPAGHARRDQRRPALRRGRRGDRQRDRRRRNRRRHRQGTHRRRGPPVP
ncbi:MAG: hypothetical protein DMD58_10925 [Gemmatimonadetes bacterium]|nr:MAG: hypothetical protein DMD58_10925 [Gemmatimonadota bacterium]